MPSGSYLNHQCSDGLAEQNWSRRVIVPRRVSFTSSRRWRCTHLFYCTITLYTVSLSGKVDDEPTLHECWSSGIRLSLGHTDPPPVSPIHTPTDLPFRLLRSQLRISSCFVSVSGRPACLVRPGCRRLLCLISFAFLR